jgi:NitT/TauT family transport system substrate-binding protein
MTMRNIIRAAGGSAAVIAALCLLARPAAAAEKILYLLPAPVTLPAFAPWVLAQHLGYYAAAGYEVDFQTARGGVDVAKQVGLGNAPIGGAVGDTSIIVRANGVPVRTVALMGGGSMTVIVARKDRGISKLQDLKGKTVTVLSYQDTTFYAFLGSLASVGMSRNDLDTQAVGPAAITSLLIAGKADACACVPDWEVQVQDALPGNTVSLPALDYFPAMAQAIVASDAVIKERPAMIRAVVQATLRGMTYIMQHPAQAVSVYAEAMPSSAANREQIAHIFLNFTERTYKGQKVVGEMDVKRLAALQDFYLAQKLIERATPVDELYTNEFVR